MDDAEFVWFYRSSSILNENNPFRSSANNETHRPVCNAHPMERGIFIQLLNIRPLALNSLAIAIGRFVRFEFYYATSNHFYQQLLFVAFLPSSSSHIIMPAMIRQLIHKTCSSAAAVGKWRLVFDGI